MHTATIRLKCKEAGLVISRVWHGWTTPANADAYEALFKSEIFTGIQDRQIDARSQHYQVKADMRA